MAALGGPLYYCLLCDIFYESSKWIDVNPQSWDTAVLLVDTSSNGVVGLVYIKMNAEVK